MRKFWDERGYVVTDTELMQEYARMNQAGENVDGLTYAQYARNCQSGEGGTLSELKEAR